MDGYELFRRDRRGKRGGGLPLYVRDCFDCIDRNDCDDKVECLWVKMRGKPNKANILLVVCYRPPNQDEEVDEVFYKRLAEVSRSLALVLVVTLTYRTSAGNTTQQRGNSLEGSWSVWRVTS